MTSRYIKSLALALAITLLVAALGNWWGGVSFLLLPGIFAAALVFPQGIHSDWGTTYMVLAGIMNVILLWPVLWCWTLIRRVRRPATASR